ncbi:PagK family vesicle-borne virulence factor [Salmonella enterica]|uniref:PagK family vesicle-borne virulence factor n=1 Tax=Salmonella enterica TaxID=28901 RepID=UPI0009B1246A|nr:PagK family vesicle-borne virulence factor [Salmonella enterica]
MRHRIFLPLLLVLSATAFSASAMAASDSTPPPQIIQNTPPMAGRQSPHYGFALNGVMAGHQI